MRSRSFVFFALAAIALVVVGVVCRSEGMRAAVAGKDLVLAWCRLHPLALFAAIVILPGLAFPVAPLLILAGAVWGSSPSACGISLLAVMLNMAWSHFLASGFCRNLLERLLGNHWQRWKFKAGTQDWRLAVILRLTPGVPLFAQNYLLGLLGVPWHHSLGVAIPTTGLYVCGFVLTSGAIFEGKTGLFILGLSLLIAASLVVKVLQQRLAKRHDRPALPLA